MTVEARSDVLPGPRVTVTGANGDYRLPALPPGSYTVKFDLSGMQSLTRKAQVQLAQDTAADVTLGVSGVAETVTVTAEASLIDKDSATIATGLSNEQIHGLPVGQDYRDLQKLIPGVQYTQDADARAERRRQRPGQRLPVRRRQRDRCPCSAPCPPSRRRTTSPRSRSSAAARGPSTSTARAASPWTR